MTSLIHPSGKRGTVIAECADQEHNTMSSARAPTQTSQNRKEMQKKKKEVGCKHRLLKYFK